MPPKSKGPSAAEEAAAAEAAAAAAEAEAAAAEDRELLVEICAELCEEVLARSLVAARHEELDQYQCAVAAEDALSQMNRVISWATLAYRPSPLVDDHRLPGGATPASPPSLLAPPEGKWSPERAPGLALMDRHSRFEVVSAPPAAKPPPPASRGRTPGTMDGGRGGGTRGKSPGGRSKTPGFESGTWAEEKVEIRDLLDPTEEANGKKGGRNNLEREYFAQMERDKQAAAAREAAEAARLEAAQAVKKEWDETMRDVEGKKWTVDASGKVIVVETVDGDKLPPRSVPMKYATEKAPPPPGGAKGASAAASSPGGAASPSKFTGPGSAFKESMDYQPPLSKTLLPEDGVELMYDGKRKAGREIKGVEGKMSVAEYAEKTGFGPPGDRTASMDTNEFDATMAVNSGGKNARNGGKKDSKAATKFPLLDPLKGGRPRADAAPTSPASVDGGVTLGTGGAAGLLGETSAVGSIEGGFASSPSGQYDSWLAAEEAAKALELEKLQEMQNAVGSGEAVNMAIPAQGRGRPQILPKANRDIRNAYLPSQTPTAYRAKLAPPSLVGFSTGHGSVSSPGEKADVSPAKLAEVVVPEESEEQGLRYQIAINNGTREGTRG